MNWKWMRSLLVDTSDIIKRLEIFGGKSEARNEHPCLFGFAFLYLGSYLHILDKRESSFIFVCTADSRPNNWSSCVATHTYRRMKEVLHELLAEFNRRGRDASWTVLISWGVSSHPLTILPRIETFYWKWKGRMETLHIFYRPIFYTVTTLKIRPKITNSKSIGQIAH